jgi:hypothetical protein
MRNQPRRRELRTHTGTPPTLNASGVICMSLLIGALVTFLVVILILYLVNMLPIDGRAKQIIRIIVIVIGVLNLLRPLMY